MSSSPDILPEAAAELARQGKDAELSELLKQGLDVDLRDAKGNTLLMLSSYHGKTEVVRMLLKSGATVDLRNEKGQTPLGGVAFKGYAEIATLLLDAGADPLAGQREGHVNARAVSAAMGERGDAVAFGAEALHGQFEFVRHS